MPGCHVTLSGSEVHEEAANEEPQHYKQPVPGQLKPAIKSLRQKHQQDDWCHRRTVEEMRCRIQQVQIILDGACGSPLLPSPDRACEVQLATGRRLPFWAQQENYPGQRPMNQAMEEVAD